MPEPRVFCLIKPDAVRRGLVGTILERLEVSFHIRELELVRAPEMLMQQHYLWHAGQDYFAPLIEFMCSGPVIAMILEYRYTDDDAVEAMRKLVDSVRAQYGLSDAPRRNNLIHGSDSWEEAERECKLWFG